MIICAMDLGSVTNVMEEPVVELPLLTGPAGMGGALCIDPEAAAAGCTSLKKIQPVVANLE